MKTSVRRGTRRDTKAFLELLVGLANFERLEPPDAGARRRIARDIFVEKRLNLLVALTGGKCVGYALYFFAYSSFLARPTLYIEDIFVSADARRRGVGEALFRACAREAVKAHCGRMEWAVLTWNKNAIEFYEKMGATRLADWYVYRLDAKALRSASSENPEERTRAD
jgi:GNAT superfamily N-acetyltransferase